MSLRDLPPRAHLDHLRNEAKALHRAFRARDASAIHRIRDVLGDAASASQDADAANRVVRAQPRIARDSLHVAAVLGSVDDARRLIAEDPTRVSARAGDSPAEPLLFLCHSPFHGESAERDAGLLATTRLLLEAGADPNTTDNRYGVPALYAVTGMRSVLPIARLLLDAGANPTDGESVFHAAERFHEDALELLLAAGADLNRTGEWGNTALYFLLRWHDIEREPRVRQGLGWLLDHGASPNVPCGKEQENALHVSARLGQSVSTVMLLLDHGADIAVRDPEHHATPLGWATFGADHVADAEGEYAATVRALLDAGARWREEEYWPRHAGVQAVLMSSGHRAPREI